MPLGATMSLVAGLAAAGLGRTRRSRVGWALAGAAAPFAVVLASLLAWDTAWQGIPTGLTLGALLAAAAVRWLLQPGAGLCDSPAALRSARVPAAGPG